MTATLAILTNRPTALRHGNTLGACLRGRAGWAVLAGLFASVALAAPDAALRIGNGGEPLTLDPQRYTLNLEEKILADLFEGLTAHDARGNIVPGAAESWTTSADGLVWTFKLRPNARWSDGAPLTAEDFAFAFRRLQDPRTAANLAHFLYAIDGAEAVNAGEAPPSRLGVEAVNAHTLRIRLRAPFPFFAERLIYPTGAPVPKHVVEQLGERWVRPGNMVTNGAYTLADWQPQRFVRVTKNPHYHAADTVRVDAVTYHPVADPNAAYNRYLAGELDIIGDFPPSAIETLAQERPGEMRLSPLLSIMYLVFNVAKPPFDDARVREALARAVDRRLLTEKVHKSGERASASFVPPLVGGYESAVQPRGVDIAAAKALLAAAGYDDANPLAITLRHIAGADSKKVQVAIAAMWRAIGVTTRLHHAELNAHFAALRQGDFEVAQAGWFGENNPEHYLELLVSSAGDVNYGRFQDAQVDALMAQAKRTAVLTERVALLRQVEAAALVVHPVVPLYSVTVRSLVSPRVAGWFPNPRNTHPARYLRLRPEPPAR